MFDARAAMSAWEPDIVPTAGIGLAALAYLTSLPREGPAWPRRRTVTFFAGLLVLFVAVDGPPDVLAEQAFSAHMVQHLLIQVVSAPLLVLGAPITLLLRADPWWLRRRWLARVLRTGTARLLARPAVTFGAFAVVMVGSHLSPVYDLALRYPPAHQAEHVAYLMTACLFWWPVVGSDPAPGRPSHPARLLYLLLMMPVMALLGVAIAGSGHVLYPYYAANPPPWGATALQDQQVAGTLMWIAGMVSMPPALVVVLLRWLDAEDRAQARGARGWPAARAAGG